MQNTTADYKLEINKPSREFECKITIGDNIYNNEDIVDIILDYPQATDGFSIGNTISQSLDLTLLNRGDTIYSTSQIKVEIGIKIGSKIEYILMGYYNIDDIEKTYYTTKITAYDNMIKFETAYFSELGDKPTLQQVVNELAKITGVQFEGSLPAYTVSKLGGFSCREVLSYVASICGGNALINRSGKFTIKGLNEVNKTINGDNYFDYKREEVKYKVGQVSCQVDENNILSKGSLGSDSMELVFENPWVTPTILTDIYNKLNGLYYLGYSMKWQGDLSLDPYDIITVTDVKNVTRKIPILSRKLTYTGGLTSEIGAKGETKNKNSFSSSGSTTNKVNRLVTEQAVIKEALIEKANIKDLKATNAEIANLKAKDAEIEKAIIGVAYIKDLNAINANIQNLIAADAKINTALIGKADITQLNAISGKINVLESDTANIKNLLAGNITGESGQLIHLTASNVTIADAVIKNLIASKISVADLQAGTISTNKFSISSADGGLNIVGPTMQFKDKNNKVRIQMGQDAQGNFNFILRGTDGTTTLIDHTGIKEKAIADDLIKSNMVAADAIGEKQINYSSLITGLNKDTNTQLIKASKVAIDLAGQTLDIAFNEIKSNVDNIQVGGRNYILNSTAEKNIINNYFATYLISKDKANMQGKSVTVSFDAKKVEGSPGVNMYVYFRGAAAIKPDSGKIGDVTTEYRRYIVTFTAPDDLNSATHLAINMTTDKANVYIKNAKLEIGTKDTDFIVAPEDIEEKIESNTTAISVQQGKIEGVISESSITKGDVTTLKNNYTSLKATVEGVNSIVASHTSSITTIGSKADNALTTATNANSKIDGLQVGGRNLALNSGITVSNGTYNIKNYTLSENLISGKEYTVQIWGDVASGKNFGLWLGGGNTSCGSFASMGNGVFKLTFKVPATIGGNGSKKAINIYAVPSGNTATSTINKIKIEKGNKATDWTPAPEDIDANITGLTGKVTTVENKQTSLEQNLDSFKTTVSSNYSTKTELSTVDGKVTGLTGRVSTAESSITQLNNQITQKVEATEVNSIVNNKIDKIEVGGVNLLIKKNITKNKYVNNNGGTVDNSEWFHSDYITVKGFKNVRISGFTNLGSSPSTCFYDSNKTFISGINNNNAGNISGVANRCELMTVPENAVYMICSGKIADLSTFKIEKGTKATDWTPAPEDVDSSINAIDSKVETTKKQVSVIETSLNGITQRVSSTESTISTHTTQLGTVDNRINTSLNSAKSYADTKKTEAINSASTDATNKANKSLTDAKSYTNGQITTVNKTITEKVAEIKTTTDAITQRVSSTESKVSAVTTTANNANSKIDGLQVGGRNLYKGTGDFSKNYWIADNIQDFELNNKYKQVLTKDYLEVGFRLSTATAKQGFDFSDTSKSWTISAMVKAVSEGQILDITLDADRTNYNPQSLTTFWKRYSWTFKGNRTLSTFRFNGNSVQKTDGCYIAQIKVEEGNKATDWTPAPEDIDSSINVVDSKIETTNNKVATIETNLSGITSKVTDLESTTSTINGKITSHENRLNTAESKITASAIVSTVSSSTTYKNDMNSKANQSALNTTNSNLSSLTTRMNTAEQKITPSAITTTISSAINGGTSSISTTQFVMDKNGFAVKNGAITVKDKANKRVAYVTTSGLFGSDTGYGAYTDGTGGMHYTGSIIYKNPNGSGNTGDILIETNDKVRIKNSADANGVQGNKYQELCCRRVNLSGYEFGNSSQLFIGSEDKLATTVILYNQITDKQMGIRANDAVFSSLSVSGYKNRIVRTSSGTVGMNAYETTECLFGDIGEGKIIDGECIIAFDPIFLDTVNTDFGYYVFLTKCGEGDIYVANRTEEYFVIKGTEGLEFCWEVKCKQRGYEVDRMLLQNDIDNYEDDMPSEIITNVDEALEGDITAYEINKELNDIEMEMKLYEDFNEH